MRLTLLILLAVAPILSAAPSLPQRGMVQEFDSIAELLATSPTQITKTYVVKGLFAINDGLAGKFYFYPSDTSTTNETDCFAWGTGRLRRTYDGVTASRVIVTGNSTNYANQMTIGEWFRMNNISEGVAYFDANGFLTNGVATNVANINPTDNVMPVRVSSTEFGDGPFKVPSAGSTNAIASGGVYFGPGLTNGMARSADDMLFKLGGTNFFQMRRVGGAPYLDFINDLTSSSGSITEANGQIIMGDDQAAGLFSGNSTFTILNSGSAILKKGTSPSDLSIYGFLSGASDSAFLKVSHGGTNGAIVFDSKSSGTAGNPRPFAFTNAGVILPNFTKTQRDALTGVEGMAVFQTDNEKGVRVYQNSTWVPQNGLPMVPSYYDGWTAYYTNIVLTNLAQGVRDVFTVPTGYKAFGVSGTLANSTNSSSITTVASIHEGSNYRRLGTYQGATSNSPASWATAGFTYLLEAGDVIAITNGAAGFYFNGTFKLMKDSAPYKQARLYGLSTSPTLLYTVPTNTIAIPIQTSQLASTLFGNLSFVNDSGGNRTYKVYLVPPGLAADDSTLIYSSTSGTALSATTVAPVMTQGTSIWVSTDDATELQWVRFAVYEAPLTP